MIDERLHNLTVPHAEEPPKEASRSIGAPPSFETGSSIGRIRTDALDTM